MALRLNRRVRRKLRPLGLAAGIAASAAVAAPANAVVSNASDIWINEFHYDNAGTDSGEFVEIAVGPSFAGNLSDLVVTLYNGSGGGTYNPTFNLSAATAGSSVNGYTFYSLGYLPNGIQNGSPDGLALSNAGSVLFFLSYEGAFQATNGVANGLTSTNLPVSQAGTELAGSSLGLSGSGLTYGDFSWQAFPGGATSSGLNGGQQLAAAVTKFTWDADAATGGVQDGGGTWADGGNNWHASGTQRTWSNAVPNSATFGGGGAGLHTVTLSGAIIAKDLAFVAGPTYTLSDGGNAANNLSVQGNIEAQQSANIDANVTFSGGNSVTVSGGQTLALQGDLQGTTGFTVGGTGRVRLENTNLSYQGSININAAATFEVAASATTGLGPVASGFSSNATFTGEGAIDGGLNARDSRVEGNLTLGNALLASGGIVSGTIAPGYDSGDKSGQLSVATNLQLFTTTYNWSLTALTDAASGGVGGQDWDLISVGGEIYAGNTLQTLALDFSGTQAPNSGDAFWNSDRRWKILDAAANGTTTPGTAVTFSNVSGAPQGFATELGTGSDLGDIFLTYTAPTGPGPTGTGLVAITEFMANPSGTSNPDSTLEWIELHNYGDEAVTLNGWRLQDEDTEGYNLGDVQIEAGGFLILARDKAAFEAEWLAGVADARVIEQNPDTLFLSNSDDELVLLDANGDPVWRLAYTGDGAQADGFSTFLADAGFALTDYGTKAGDKIDADGNDPATGTLGYQSNSFQRDLAAYASLRGDLGSPLAISQVPEPASLALLAGGAALIGLRRKR